MVVELREQPFNPWDVLQRYESHHTAMTVKFGATAVFVGTLRDVNQGDTVTAMYLEHYPGMTEQHLQAIVAEAQARWAVLDTLIVHRVGDVHPEETLVLVAVWSVHRGDAFDASRFIMEQLKHRAPLWKRESLANGTDRWVESNTDGYQR
ncbi:MAG: molybdenum cofactor biosynthesis protein MoaE [Methylomonas sp.]|nr:molybdenum cofactor biosynthesis protein MoaE [Methylomonas sp.]